MQDRRVALLAAQEPALRGLDHAHLLTLRSLRVYTDEYTVQRTYTGEQGVP